ncbi:MAG: SGNH/GDSL hydrolase family protein, partial [Proteobacteria bacterium]|nr:SGNH/GDSL hydrolase family protein [Pseudomonadota bacterium]
MARLALLVCSLAVAMAIVELGLRLAHYGGLRAPVPSEEDELRTLHPTRGWALTPGARALVENAEFTVEVAINSRGLRDVEHAPEPADGQRRIAVLGDSFMEANQVALEKTFARALDRALDGTEVINLGVGGYGSAQQWLALREEGLGYRPDLVLVAFYYNDVRNNSRTLEGWLWGEEAPKVFGRPYARIDASGAVVVDGPDYERARRWAEKRRAKERRRRGPALLSVRQIRALFDAGGELRRHDPNLWLGPLLADFNSGWSAAEQSVDAYTAAWEKAWQVTERVLTEIGRTSREAGAEVLVFSVPARFQVEP